MYRKMVWKRINLLNKTWAHKSIWAERRNGEDGWDLSVTGMGRWRLAKSNHKFMQVHITWRYVMSRLSILSGQTTRQQRPFLCYQISPSLRYFVNYLGLYMYYIPSTAEFISVQVSIYNDVTAGSISSNVKGNNDRKIRLQRRGTSV